MRNITKRTIREPVDAFQVDREIREIKSLLQDLPILFGNGAPESSVNARVGTLFLRLDGGSSTTLYVKESGDGTNTGWIAK